MEKKKILTQSQALTLLIQSVRYCGFSQEDILLLHTVMQCNIERFLAERDTQAARRKKPDA